MLEFAVIDDPSTDWPLASSGNATKFGCELVQDISDGPWAAGSHVIGQGDMIKIYIGDTDGLMIGYSETVTIKIMPAYGQMCLVSFTTGDSFSSDYISMA
jgi:archaellin